MFTKGIASNGWVFVSFLLLHACSENKQAPKAPVLDIPVINVLVQDVPIITEFTGQTLGEEDIQISPRVRGLIEGIHFKEGSFVNKGQLLYTIESLTYQNEVNIAEASLAEAKSRYASSKADYERLDALVKMKAVSQREYEEAQSKYEAGKGQVSSAEAQLRNAKINLGYCSILAPLSGIIGITKMQVGDYATPGPNSNLTTISSTQVIRVRFTLNESEVLRLMKEKQKENSNLSGGNNIRLRLSDGSDYDTTGVFNFANREIDPTTGAIVLEARFPNPKQILRPGQYVKVLVNAETRKNAVLIPQRSVIEMQGLYQVYILGDSNKVTLSMIQAGPVYKDAYVVEEGLKGGEKIAVGGTQLLRNGSVINPKNTDWFPGMPQQKPATSK